MSQVRYKVLPLIRDLKIQAKLPPFIASTLPSKQFLPSLLERDSTIKCKPKCVGVSLIQTGFQNLWKWKPRCLANKRSHRQPTRHSGHKGVQYNQCEVWKLRQKSEHSFYCFQCCAFWCDDCIGLHNGIRANKEHHALALKDFKDQDFENILKQPAFCGVPGHGKKELEFFCRSCEVAICYSCIAILHECHPEMPLGEAANERNYMLKLPLNPRKKE